MSFYLAADAQLMGLVSRHFGKLRHPQKSLPALMPCLATLLTISTLQCGQPGITFWLALGTVIPRVGVTAGGCAINAIN